MLKYLILITLIQYRVCISVKNVEDELKASERIIEDSVVEYVHNDNDVLKTSEKVIEDPVVEHAANIDVSKPNKNPEKDPVKVIKDPVEVIKDPVEVIKDPVEVTKDPVQVIKDREVIKDPVVDHVVNKDKVNKDVVKEDVESKPVTEDVQEVVKDKDGVTEIGNEDGKEKVKYVEDPLTDEEINEDEEKPGYSPSFRDLNYACEANGERGYCQASCPNGIVLSGGNCDIFGKFCCQNRYTCGNKTSDYISVFTPGGNNLRTIQQCNLLVEVADSSICQIRIDFKVCQLSQPTQTNAGTTPMQCNLDSISITGQQHPVPKVCGACSNQHFYIHLNQSMGDKAININVQLANRLTESSPDLVDAPIFDIRITQLSCPIKDSSILGYIKYKCSQADFYALAPAGCLQYFTERTGQFKSLVFDTSRALAANRLPSGLNYAVCFKKNPNANCIRLTSPQFSIGNANPCVDRFACVEMWTSNANTAPSLQANREVCGTAFSSTTTLFCSGESPFFVKIRTDNVYSANTENGFVVNFENPPAGGCPTFP